MRTKTANVRRRKVLATLNLSSYRESLIAVLKLRCAKTGCYSLLAALPAVPASNMQEARADGTKRAESSVAGQYPRPAVRMNKGCGRSALLRRQSGFLLPHQQGSFWPLSAQGGADDCPGRPIPGGTYTAAAPFIDSGDTTGANNTVTRAHFIDYIYYFFDAPGPDHMYSFTLTGRGPNPQIRVSTTAPIFGPIIYILQGGFAGDCPASTENEVFNELVMAGPAPGGTVTLGMSNLPLNVPLYLFVDSRSGSSGGSGPYTIRMQDVTIQPTGVCPNPVDCTEFFVRQHYVDFLNREPDAAGLAFWAREITSCGADAECAEAKRVNVSAAFFLSIEFQETGFLAYRFYKAAYGDATSPNVPGTVPVIRHLESVQDSQNIGRNVRVGIGNWQQQLEQNKQAYALEFVQRQRFTQAFPASLGADEFVNRLDQQAGGVLSADEKAQLVALLGDSPADAARRAQVLRAVAEDADLRAAELNRAFVLMQYFGYLRRNPDEGPDPDFAGWRFWLDKLEQFNGDFVRAEMVRAFISSAEHRQRFAQ